MRVAIVNDLALAREVLRRLVLSVEGHSIAWMACDGAEAVRKAATDRPDVILMDLVMPVMDGVEATRRIMGETPCPILLVTSSVCGNFSKVYEAMGYGGLDAVNTPTLGADGKIHNGEGLLARLAHVGKSGQTILEGNLVPALPRAAAHGLPVVAFGASTGGPEALARILESFPADPPAAILVAQHIGVDFAPSLADWLRQRTRQRVRLARAGDCLVRGEIHVAASNDHLVLARDGRLAYVSEPADYPYRPSADVLFASLAAHGPRRGVAALLTGMGSDGARGLLQLRRTGWFTFAQDQESSVVYGMPQAAAQMDAACEVLSLSKLAAAILAQLARITSEGSVR